MSTSSQKKRFDGFNGRVRDVALGLIVALSVLVFRLWYLQVVRGEEFAQQAESNHLRFCPMKAPRGIICGQDESVVLADNRAVYDIVLVPAEIIGDQETVCTRLESLVEDVSAQNLMDAIAENKKEPYTQLLVKADATKTELTRVQEFANDLSGVFTIVRPQRRYLRGKTAGQLLGYINEVWKEELAPDRPEFKPGYKRGDVVGRAGVEKAYESVLRGQDGQLWVSVFAAGTPQVLTDAYGKPYVEKDTFGRSLEPGYRMDPMPGKPLFLTIDMGLQAECERILGTEMGAIVVLNADTGAVLAMASAPSYDPGVFVSAKRREERNAVLEDKTEPTLSRCFQKHYPPGSVFKVLLAIAALEEKELTEHTTFSCPGFLENGGRIWHCHQHSGHGAVSIVDALAKSCDVFFWNVGLRLGVDRTSRWARELRVGELTGIDLKQEVPGCVPSREWKQEYYSKVVKNKWEQQWYPYDTLCLAIGQGSTVTTPLQNALLIASVINGGRRVRPFINRDLEPDVSEPLISERTLRIVQEGLRKCIETGTGRECRIPGLAIVGKTGSAQIVGLQQQEKYGNKQENMPYEMRDHALFVAGTSEESPHIAVSIIVEHGIHGSTGAAPLAKRVFEYIYGKRTPIPAVALRTEAPRSAAPRSAALRTEPQ